VKNQRVREHAKPRPEYARVSVPISGDDKNLITLSKVIEEVLVAEETRVLTRKRVALLEGMADLAEKLARRCRARALYLHLHPGE
jgi:hypothetical protein